MGTVTEYSNISPGEDKLTITELPSLSQPRVAHACGLYRDADKQMLIVTGGRFDWKLLSSTEVYDYSQGRRGTWRETTPLPSSRWGIRGARVGSVFHICGGFDGSRYQGEILAWEPLTQSWSVVGSLSKARDVHSVTEIPLD